MEPFAEVQEASRPGGIRFRRAFWIFAISLFLYGGQARQAMEAVPVGQKSLQAIPAEEFARIVREFSEEEGYFRSDNFVSNETSYLHVLDKLKELGAMGGAYLGVGPEQNFTYIAKIRPQIAFIIDIRRQAVIQHLMFKAIFHMAETPARFLSFLFCMPLAGPGKPGADASAEELMRYFSNAATDGAAFPRNLALIRDTIVNKFHVPLEGRDPEMLEYVYAAFRNENLNLQYRSSMFSVYPSYRSRRSVPRSYYPTIRDLILETDLHGRHGNFLASRSDYEFVRGLQVSNRVIPLVGDFGGSKALAAVAAYLKKNGYTVTAYYTSNVEQYLFSSGDFEAFAENVGRLPITEESLFIRAFPNSRIPHPAQVGGHRLTTLLQKMVVFLDDFRKGLYPDYWTLVRTHYITAQ